MRHYAASFSLFPEEEGAAFANTGALRPHVRHQSPQRGAGTSSNDADIVAALK